jgi:prepilin-type N-terminal cleavage/methylation domain-containing protein
VKTSKMSAYIKKGFTLIELLIVMAILGVLAIVVLVAINPVQQLARTRDSGRKSTVTQVGHSLEAYFTSHGGQYLNATNCGAAGTMTSWMTCLQVAGELASVPGAIAYSAGGTPCDLEAGVIGNVQNSICYVVNPTSDWAIVYASLESASETSKCPTLAPYEYYVWSTVDGRGGLVCLTNAPDRPNPGEQSSYWSAIQ